MKGGAGSRSLLFLIPVQAQALDGSSTHDVLLQDLVDVLAVDVGVPYAFRVDDQDRSLLAAIHAPGRIDAHPAWAGKSQCLDPLFGIIPQGARILLLATPPPVGALVGAKKDVLSIVQEAPMPLFHRPKPSDDPSPAAAAAIREASDRCVACGLCLPHCPTYGDSLNENESPRGRISLLRAAADGVLPVTPALTTHIDHCLGCLACEKACPSRVPYGALLKNGRAWLTGKSPWTWRRQWHRALIQAVDRPGAVATAYGAARILGALSWPRAAPMGLREAVRGLPARPRPALVDRKEAHPADVALFRGCTADLDRPALNAAMRILHALGVRVHVPSAQGCCGALAAHAGFADIASRQRQRNRQAFAGSAPVLVSVASGCAAELRHDDAYPGGQFPAVSDIHRYLVEQTDLGRLALSPLPQTIAVHDPCSLRNALGDTRFVYDLLARIPEARVIALPGNEVCCGAAGDYFLREPARAHALARPKAAAARALGADVVVSANIGCALHLSAALARQGVNVPVQHPLLVVARQLPPLGDPC